MPRAMAVSDVQAAGPPRMPRELSRQSGRATRQRLHWKRAYAVATCGAVPVALVCAPPFFHAIEFGAEEEFHNTPLLSDPVRRQMELRGV